MIRRARVRRGASAPAQGAGCFFAFAFAATSAVLSSAPLFAGFLSNLQHSNGPRSFARKRHRAQRTSSREPRFRRKSRGILRLESLRISSERGAAAGHFLLKARRVFGAWRLSRFGRRDHDVAQLGQKIIKILRTDIFELGEHTFDHRSAIMFAIIRAAVHFRFMHHFKCGAND